MAVDTTTTVIHADYDHPQGMPCRECRTDDAKGKKPKTKKARK